MRKERRQPGKQENCDITCCLTLLLKSPGKRSWRFCVKYYHASCPRQGSGEIAEIILNHIDFDYTPVKEVSIAGPGFINFKLRPSWLYPVMETADRSDRKYGHSNIGQGKKVQVEFVRVQSYRFPSYGECQELPWEIPLPAFLKLLDTM